MVAGGQESQPGEVAEDACRPDAVREDHDAVQLQPMRVGEAASVIDGPAQRGALLLEGSGPVTRPPAGGQVELVPVVVAPVIAGGQQLGLVAEAANDLFLRQRQLARHGRDGHVEAVLARPRHQQVVVQAQPVAAQRRVVDGPVGERRRSVPGSLAVQLPEEEDRHHQAA